MLGTWSGAGRGDYPTIEPFAYTEEVAIDHIGKPFLTYRQRTWEHGSGQPLHTEMGYFRPVATNGAELVLAQPSGVVEVLSGSVTGTEMSLATTMVGTTPTAKEVLRVERRLMVDGDELVYELSMTAVGQSHQRHLLATLHRQ